MARSIFAFVLLFVTLLVGITSCNGQGTGVAVNCSSNVQLNITGGIFCSLLGNIIPGFPNNPLPGVNVTLSCGGMTIASVLTNSMGFFQFTVNASSLNLANLGSCRVIVPLPVNANCILLPFIGTLGAPIILTGATQTVTGVILNFLTLAFRLI